MPPVSLAKRIGQVAKESAKRSSPVWAGPESDAPNGGVTQSLLGRFLSCKERFRLLVVEGLKPKDAFEPRIEYGNMWHVCEESLAEGSGQHQTALKTHSHKLCMKYPAQRDEIGHWYELCKQFFPLYVEHWRRHPDVKKRTPLLQEQVFNVPYKLPSGRTVYLRGKWDAVDLIDEAPKGVYSQENKTKSTIDKQKIARQLKFDIQTMFYHIALEGIREQMRESLKRTLKTGKNVYMEAYGKMDESARELLFEPNPLRGVRYNVIRRPAHKSVENALKKFNEDKEANRIEEWFCRWRVEIGPGDVAKFRHECLDPVLENLCDDWEWWAWCKEDGKDDVFDGETRRRSFPAHRPLHFRFPYGVYNPISEGGFGDLDGYMETGSEVGLQRATELFPELAK